MDRNGRVELGLGGDIIGLVVLREPDAVGPRALAQIVAGEDPRRDGPNLLDQSIDRVVPGASLGLGTVQRVGVAILVTPIKKRAVGALLEIHTTSFRRATLEDLENAVSEKGEFAAAAPLDERCHRPPQPVPG